MTIPIRNLYYLFCYAWQRFPEGGAVEVGVEESPDIPNLFARLLINSAHRLLRRGLDRGYLELIEETRAPRGRVLLGEIAKQQTLRRGAVICSHDELTPDVLHNQIIKATASSLARAPQLQPSYAHELKLLVRRMDQVSDIQLRGDLFSRVQLSRNTGQYAVALKLCETIFRSLLPTEAGAGSRFAEIFEDEARMNVVFEEFLRNFYKLEQREFTHVGAETMSWNGESLDDAGWAYLPNMVTDITMRSPERIMVIDAKYYAKAFGDSYGTPKLHSSNLYQLMTYLEHAGLKSPGLPVEGALIYPAIGEPIRLRYRLGGHRVQIATIDFSQPWPKIHDALLDLLRSDEAPIPELDKAA